MKEGRRTLTLGVRNKSGVRSLQDACRHKILQRIGVDNIQNVWVLPLPTVIKEFLCTFNIPTDFALDDMHVEYNFNFKPRASQSPPDLSRKMYFLRDEYFTEIGKKKRSVYNMQLFGIATDDQHENAGNVERFQASKSNDMSFTVA